MDSKPSIQQAALESEAALLKALRNKMARDLDEGVPPHVVPRMVAELRDVDRRLRDLGDTETDAIAQAAATPDEPWDPSLI